MSCGGWQAVSFASRYPSYVSFLYLDAPLLSFFGLCEPYQTNWIEEHKAARSYQTPGERFADNDLPIHRLKTLTDNRLPVALVYGGVDKVVEPKLNAEALLDYYTVQGTPIKVWYKPECDHHPHVAVNLDEVMDYIEANEL